MSINIVPPNKNIELHLSDGRVLEGPRGASVGEFLQTVKDDFSAPIVAAIINNEIHELSYLIEMEARCTPVTMDSADGARIYRRSLVFLLEMAFMDLFPNGKLTIDHSLSSGGFYCQVTERGALAQDELDALKLHMQKLVEENHPYERKEVPAQVAIEYFKMRGYDDKVRLFAYRQKDYVTLYSLNGQMDYMHGYMVPSTGYLRWFDLNLINGGFTIQFPRRHAPTDLEPMGDYPKLINTFRQYGDWLESLNIDNVGALNDAVLSGRADEILLVSEALHELNVADIALQIAQKNSRIILIAGPSSSGKTTTSRRLAIQLLARGISPYPLELDNYFIDRDKTPLGEDGKPDFENLEALDLPRLAEDLEKILAGEKVQLPRYNFKSGKSEAGDIIQLKDGQPLILEGIHGMNPRLISDRWSGAAFRVYVSALTQLNLDRHNRVSTTDTRLIRRMVRDARERGYSAAQTISRWESVRRGEKRHIFPYQENADVMFNSALVYELSVLRPFAEPLLRQVQYRAPEYIEARRLLAFLEWFLPLDASLVPANSIVREFLGGSGLKDFKIWRG
ncbi:nucleoside kinase [Candidatus Villigracilis saccharophilus]|uniref:nucleoside kinase n=1 Tax=Candidatus Villigracilis saccharophilus TaxID=3140684 RepID=UPI003134CFD1|nr:nucleoside kinase [Anaerolineales bacterium]